MFGIISNGCFVTDAPCTNRLSLRLCSSVATRGWTTSYMVVCGNIQGTGIFLQVVRDNANPTKKQLKAWIDHSEEKL
jgi:hypothetical protein